jgi:DNA-binding response OmpR family regulator
MTAAQREAERKKRILIVEDEESTSKFLSFRLKKLGFDVFVAADGAKGLKMAEEEMPDLIILDLGLPKLPGEEVCRNIKDSFDDKIASIPIIFLTVKDSVVDKVFAKAIGANAYVTKPFDFEDLMKEISRFLKQD